MKLPESRRSRLVLVVVAAAIIAGYIAISRAVPHEDLQKLLEDFSDTLGSWTYLLVGAFAFLETGAFVGLVVPGETIMLIGGAVAGQGAVDLYLLVAIAWFSAFAGDSTSFLLGRKLGRRFVLERGPRFGISNERFGQVEAYFDRHGGKTILIGRFIGFVRALAPFVAGSSGMRFRAFAPYSILGTGIWATAHILIGYLFSRSVEEAARYAGRGVLLLGTLIAFIVGSIWLLRFLRMEENRRRAVAWIERRRLLRPALALARRLEPQARFLWARLTPGGRFGLEFTTVLAVLAVGLFTVASYTEIVTANHGPTTGDGWATDISLDLRSGWLTDVAKIVTVLGAPGVVLGLALAASLALAARGEWAQLAVFVSSLAVAFIAVDLFKSSIDRPRPEGGLVGADGSSYPSGHATYSMIYVWLAVTLAWRVMPDITRRTAVVVGGVAIAALIGLSRVYLGVHYMSDVSAGWGLGGSAFAICVAVGLVAGQLRPGGGLRHNVARVGAGGEDRE